MRSIKSIYSNRFVLRALFTWFIFIPVAFVNGAIREGVYKPMVGDLAAHQISCLTGSLAFVAVGYFMLKQVIAEVENKVLWLTGTIWVIMTILFEFAMGYFSRTPLDRLLNDYNVFEGRLWALVLLTIFLTPVLVKKMIERRFKKRQVKNASLNLHMK